MNGTEQRLHKTATAALAERVGNVETCLVGVAEDVKQGMERRRATCQERWDETCTTLKWHRDSFNALRNRGFWGRLNWLVTGR